jgi:single-strand DNA-binding protein
MAGLNKVMLIGNLGADPEIRSLNNGGSVANLRIATNKSWKDRDGNKQEKTEWHTVVCFADGLNDVIERYCVKGGRVYVEGELQTRKWQDKDGADRYSTEVVLSAFDGKLVLLDGPSGGGDRDDDRGGGRSGGRDRDDDRDRGGRGGGRGNDRGGRSSSNRDTRNAAVKRTAGRRRLSTRTLTTTFPSEFATGGGASVPPSPVSPGLADPGRTSAIFP